MSKLISELGQAPSKTPAVSGEQPTLVPDDLALVKLGSRRRQSTEQIIPAVLRGTIHQKDINSALDMITCSENIRVTKGGEIHSLQRCKKRICPVCSGIEANKWIKRINDAVEFIADDMIDDPNHHDHNLPNLPTANYPIVTLVSDTWSPDPFLLVSVEIFMVAATFTTRFTRANRTWKR